MPYLNLNGSIEGKRMKSFAGMIVLLQVVVSSLHGAESALKDHYIALNIGDGNEITFLDKEIDRPAEFSRFQNQEVPRGYSKSIYEKHLVFNSLLFVPSVKSPEDIYAMSGLAAENLFAKPELVQWQTDLKKRALSGFPEFKHAAASLPFSSTGKGGDGQNGYAVFCYLATGVDIASYYKADAISYGRHISNKSAHKKEVGIIGAIPMVNILGMVEVQSGKATGKILLNKNLLFDWVASLFIDSARTADDVLRVFFASVFDIQYDDLQHKFKKDLLEVVYY